VTPPARTQAAIELLDQILVAAREGGAAADTLIARYFTTRRYAGSKDRRAVRDLVYAAIRTAGDRPETGRAAMLLVADADPAVAATFDGSTHAPAAIAKDELRAKPGVAPQWLSKALRASGLDGAALTALAGRATLDLRVNTLMTTRDAVLAELHEAEATPHAPDGIRLPTGTNVDAMPLFNTGVIEVQDEGSQIVGLAMQAKAGERIVDLCAGAGGKTLALAATMQNKGTILACDTDRMRLSRLTPRATRAGATIVESMLLNPTREHEALADWAGRVDGVLVDAPCSGTGTWRRNPEARWRLTPDRVSRLQSTQQHVLGVAASLVRPGGALVYIVCSLLDAEGTDQVTWFLEAHPGWSVEPLTLPAGARHGHGVRLEPGRDGTDGFFVARLIAA
jgi:16S rRNA (cytosine967-C5)-methyltransferase